MKTNNVSFIVNAERSTSNVQRIAQLKVERWALSVERFLVHVHWAVQQATGLLLLGGLVGLLPGWGPLCALAQNPPTYYVDVANPTPVAPYTSWATAATNIQEAVNASTAAGRLVLVTNGVYLTGSTLAAGANRVALTNVTLRSLNGPETTIIDGGAEARCVYLGGSAVLSGFTLRNGKADSGGGVYAAAYGVVTNCIVIDNSAQGDGGGISGGTLHDCSLSGNSAQRGGGASDATLEGCTLNGNTARLGGGAHDCTLHDCTLSGNSAFDGGGACDCALYDCALTDNRANAGWEGGFPRVGHGGGVASHYSGGGVDSYRWACTLHNCTLSGNSAQGQGGGAYCATLYDCTVTGNSAEQRGGGVAGGNSYNCLVYFNRANEGANWKPAIVSLMGASIVAAEFQYSCTTPLPPGPGNIEADPQLASATHLLPTSPCLGAGSAAYTSGVDIDGEPWASPPAIGADQVWPGPSAGPLTLRITVPFTRFAAGFAVPFTAHNTGPILWSVWDFGDGTVVTNHPFLRHAWTVPGPYNVRLTGYNGSHPEGVTASLEIEVIDAVHYVNTANPAPLFPYTTWATAATNIQDAVDAGSVLGRLVLVTDGVYQVGTAQASAFSVMDFFDPLFLAHKLKQPSRAVDTWLAAQLSSETKAALETYEGQGSDLMPLKMALVRDLNGILSGSSVYDAERFEEVTLRSETEELLWQDPQGDDLVRLNRLLIEDAYPLELSRNLLALEANGPSRVVLRNPVVVRSVNGPEVTVIEGSQQDPQTGEGFDVRGAYVENESVLSGFTLTKGAAPRGAGVLCAAFGVVTNCTLVGNRAGTQWGQEGGGASGGTLYNCTLSGNVGGGAARCTLHGCILSGNDGHGAACCTLYNCRVTGNSGCGAVGAWRLSLPDEYCTLYNCTLAGNDGIGAWLATLYNCIVTGNNGADWDASTFEYSCSTPLAPGRGNISADPGFVNAAAGDFRLRYRSPCIDAAAPQTSTTDDLAGLPRPLDGNGDGVARPDMGAYEFDLRTVVPANWFTGNGLDATDPHVLSQNPDQDSQTSFQEWLTGTDPNDPLSFFRIEAVDAGPPVTVSYQGLTGRVYTLHAAPGLGGETGGGTPWAPLSGQTAVPGSGGLDVLTDTNALPRRFYRVGVDLP